MNKPDLFQTFMSRRFESLHSNTQSASNRRMGSDQPIVVHDREAQLPTRPSVPGQLILGLVPRYPRDSGVFGPWLGVQNCFCEDLEAVDGGCEGTDDRRDGILPLECGGEAIVGETSVGWAEAVDAAHVGGNADGSEWS